MAKTYHEVLFGEIDKQLTPHERRLWEGNPRTVAFRMAPVQERDGVRLVQYSASEIMGHQISPMDSAVACVLIQDDAPPDLVIKFLTQVQHRLSEVLD